MFQGCAYVPVGSNNRSGYYVSCCSPHHRSEISNKLYTRVSPPPLLLGSKVQRGLLLFRDKRVSMISRNAALRSTGSFQSCTFNNKRQRSPFFRIIVFRDSIRRFFFHPFVLAQLIKFNILRFFVSFISFEWWFQVFRSRDTL